jgi:hypothetical protein
MRVFCRVFALVCLCLVAFSAHATRITIQDPGSITLTPVTDTPFLVTFSGSCGALLPSSNPASSDMGCFGFVNRTSADWIGLTLVLTSGSPTNGGFDCDTPGVFATADCSSTTVLSFSNGVIPVEVVNTIPQYFVIAEDDLDPATITFEAYPTFAGATPEPSALVLLTTGAVLAGGLMWSRRRAFVA